jgi:protease I
MGNKKVQGLRVAALATDGFEQVELTGPLKALQRAGAAVEVIAPHAGKIQGVNALVPGKKVVVDRVLSDADPALYDALLLPGGLMNPDMLRQSEEALEFVRAFDAAGKPIAVICHGPWVLVNAGLVSGRRLTSWPGIRADVINAGGQWEDSAVVRDQNWVSSRSPQDLKAFEGAMLDLFGAHTPLRPHAELKTRQRGRGLPTLLAALMAVAGLVYAVFQRRQNVYPAQPAVTDR